MKSAEDLKIVFFGTPDFAVASLAAMVDASFKVVAVVTAPDKPSGRGLQVQSTPVKQYALANHIPVLQPFKLKAPEFIQQLQSIEADLFVVVAFRMLPELVWNMPPMGTINVHGSLLPQYRGAAPINWAIINGATETGVTTFKLKHEIDTGNILLRSAIAIEPQDNAGTVPDKLMEVGATLLVQTIRGLADDSIQEIAQECIDTPLVHAPKIFKEHMKIDWTCSALSIHNLIRGLSPYPAAFTMLQGRVLKIFSAHIGAEQPHVGSGEFDTDHKHFLRFAASDAWIYLDEVQLEGKKRMDITAFLRGFRS